MIDTNPYDESDFLELYEGKITYVGQNFLTLFVIGPLFNTRIFPLEGVDQTYKIGQSVYYAIDYKNEITYIVPMPSKKSCQDRFKSYWSE